MMNTAHGNIRTTAVTAFVLAAVTATAAQDADGQRRANTGMRARGDAVSPVEHALRRADALELTEDQRNRLEALRVEGLAERTANAARLMEVASEIRAGIVERSAVREELAALREAGAATRGNLRDQLGEILDDDQQEELRRALRRSVWQNRRGQMPGVDRQRGPWRRGGFDRGRGGSRAPRRDRPGR